MMRHPERDEDGPEGGHGFAQPDGPFLDFAQRPRDYQLGSSAPARIPPTLAVNEPDDVMFPQAVPGSSPAG